MESDEKARRTDQKKLQERRSELQAEAETGVVELGLRQQEDIEAGYRTDMAAVLHQFELKAAGSDPGFPFSKSSVSPVRN